MLEFIPLERLLLASRKTDACVGLRGGQPVAYANFAAAVDRWRTAFVAQKGQRFAFYFEDTLIFAAALLGAWQAGKCVFLPADKLPATYARLQTEVDGFAGDFPNAVLPSSLHDESLTTQSSLLTELDVEALGMVVYTSGSSGEPVAITKRLRQLFGEVATLATCFDEKLGDAAVLATVSHQHIYGLLFRVLWPLASGRPIVAERLAYPEEIIAALGQLESALLIASPAHLKRLPMNAPWAEVGGKLRGLFSSGGMLPDSAVADCLSLLKQAPIEVYGSSETGGVAWRQRNTDLAAAWQCLPHVAVRIVDACLQVKSSHLPDDEWFVSSDRAELNGTLNGTQFTLLGRADRIVKLEEKRVSLSGMERALCASGLVGDAKVVPLDGPRTTLGAVVVPNEAGWALLDQEGKLALNQRLRQVLAAEFENTVLPRSWRYEWALPHTAQGKVTEAALIALFDPRRPFARLLERDAYQAKLLIHVVDDCPYFDGHFDEAPILPGVTQLDWAMAFGRQLFPLQPDFAGMEGVKFQQIIPPGATVTLELSFKPATESAGGSDVLGYKLSSDAGPHASGRIVFGSKA